MGAHTSSWRISLFLGLYGLFDITYFQVPDTVLREWVYPRGLAAVAANLAAWLAPGEGIVAAGHHIRSALADLEIVRGCDGSGALFLVASAVLASSAGWRWKATGLLTAGALLYAVNLVRLVALYFVVAHLRDWFLVVHTYVAPILIIAIGCLFFARWSWSVRGPSRGAA